MIEITDKGFLTIPVTMKRHCLENIGVPAGGPMDPIRCLLANRLAGNQDDAGALEATFLFPGIRFTDRRAFAIVGGVEDLTLLHNGERRQIPAGRTLYSEAGDELLPCPITEGMRAYFSVSGGIEITSFRSKPVAKGDNLALFPVWNLPASRIVEKGCLSMPQETAVLRVTEGVQSDHFDPEGIRAFYQSEYRYTPQSDRMGIRLSGRAIPFAEGYDGNILSERTLMGDVQVPASGQPILLMADCQTAGGYAKIAHVITADLPLAAQLRPGSGIRFREVSVFEAHAVLHRLYREIETGIRE